MDLLRKLIEIPGPSGGEQDVRSFIKNKIKDYVDVSYVDKFGNLICRKRGTSKKLENSAMLVAHMDEIGLMIKSIDENGLIYCSAIGGLEPITLLGERVLIESKSKRKIHGIITTKEISCDEPIKKAPKIEDIFIDAGLTKKELTEAGVEIGSYLHLVTQQSNLGSDDVISGKAFDDRIGCYILIEAAKRIKKPLNDIYYVFTVQEEIGLYGAKTSVYGLEPSYAIIVDVTEADDINSKSTRCIGKGPCITIKDADMISNRCLNDWIKKVAKKIRITLQYDVSDVGTTDALNISISKGGVPSTVLSVAVRNMHTASGIASIKDINNAIRILESLLKEKHNVCIT